MKEQIISTFADYCRREVDRAHNALTIKMNGRPLFDKREAYANTLQRMLGAADLAQMMASNCTIYESIEAHYDYYKNMLESMIESFENF